MPACTCRGTHAGGVHARKHARKGLRAPVLGKTRTCMAHAAADALRRAPEAVSERCRPGVRTCACGGRRPRMHAWPCSGAHLEQHPQRGLGGDVQSAEQVDLVALKHPPKLRYVRVEVLLLRSAGRSAGTCRLCTAARRCWRRCRVGHHRPCRSSARAHFKRIPSLPGRCQRLFNVVLPGFSQSLPSLPLCKLITCFPIVEGRRRGLTVHAVYWGRELAVLPMECVQAMEPGRVISPNTLKASFTGTRRHTQSS